MHQVLLLLHHKGLQAAQVQQDSLQVMQRILQPLVLVVPVIIQLVRTPAGVFASNVVQVQLFTLLVAYIQVLQFLLQEVSLQNLVL
jgi:hypothetical protein